MREMENFEGKYIGKLFVKKLLVSSPYSKKSYECVCDCGNTCIRLHSTLKTNHMHSCGCYIKRNLVPGDSIRCSKAGKNRKNAFLNGSNIQMTLREGTIATNTSGVQGVSWSKTARKWHVYIGYQNYRATLGFFDDMATAIDVRKKAEEHIKDNTFENFYYAIRGFRLEDKLIKQFKTK